MKNRTVSIFFILIFVFSVYLFAYPERIISLGPALTEDLYLLGVGNRLIANTIYCEIPPDAKNKEKIGTVIEVDIEKIVKLKPDIVLATALTDKEQVEKLKSLEVNVVVFYQPKNFNEICEQFLKLGQLLGREKKAKEIVTDSQKKVDSIRKVTAKFPMPKVFVQLGAKPLFTVPDDSFIRDFIEFAGGINIASDAKAGYYSREKVLMSNPDIIIIVSMGVVGEEEKKNWQRHKTLNASKNNKIYIVDAHKLGSPTPVTFVDTLEELSLIFHPELKKGLKK